MRNGGVVTSTPRARRRGRPKAIDATDTKRHIIDTAYRLFYRHGIGSVSVDAVIAEAHVSKAGLYYHFGSKEHLAADVLKMRSRLILQDLHERLAKNVPSGLHCLADVVARYMSNPERRGDLFLNTIVEGFQSRMCREICLDHQRQLMECIRDCVSPSLPTAIASQALLVVYGMIVRDQIDADEHIIEHGRILLQEIARRANA